jgi:hypothetical protein
MVHTDDYALLGMQVLVCAAELPFAHPTMCTYHRLPLVDNPSCDLRVHVPAATNPQQLLLTSSAQRWPQVRYAFCVCTLLVFDATSPWCSCSWRPMR